MLHFTVPLSLNSIYEEVIKTEEGRNITFDRVRASLVQLSCPPFVVAVNESYIVGSYAFLITQYLFWLIILFYVSGDAFLFLVQISRE